MKRKVLGLLAVWLLAVPMAANALTWNWTYSGRFDTGSQMVGGGGTFTTNDLSAGSYLITGIVGTYETYGITALAGPGLGFGNNDNLLWDSSPQLSYYGVTFAANGEAHNFYWNADFGGYRENGVGTISFSATRVAGPEPVPLPAAAWLLLSGLGGLGFLRRRKVN